MLSFHPNASSQYGHFVRRGAHGLPGTSGRPALRGVRRGGQLPPRGRRGMGVIDNKPSTDIESPSPSPRVCRSIHSEGKLCSYLGRVLVIDDRPTTYTLKVSHAPISVECLFSMTLLRGAGQRQRRRRPGSQGNVHSHLPHHRCAGRD